MKKMLLFSLLVGIIFIDVYYGYEKGKAAYIWECSAIGIPSTTFIEKPIFRALGEEKQLQYCSCLFEAIPFDWSDVLMTSVSLRMIDPWGRYLSMDDATKAEVSGACLKNIES